MTADRQWVKIIARWLARIDGISGMLRLAMLGLTGVSTMSFTLKDYGLERLVWPLIGAMCVGTLLFAYYYTEGGVWNQVHRDKRDMSQNYATPFQKISNEMTARGLYAGEKGSELSQEERQAIQKEIDMAYMELRDGIEVEKDD
ncbi:hypothetical protein [His 1 virus]|uniref:Putative transmembrane protein ORF32 n=1 Tax=His1 virus (isolate Australia/Victoria) TaxID=654912 RepID=Y032_HIS1I|nr:hypothetical protein His1V_gp32 [His 1 virus]Q25BG3.1 RecName: Full=Putative transmembrane protein ORF32 [His1 virus (isolate Victoria)]AAQ13759.1 hypothetical protein [His 1 virus]